MEAMLAPAAAALAAAVETLRTGIDALLSVDLDAVAGLELAAAVAAVEVQVRRLGAVDARLLAVLDERGVAGEFGASSTLDLLRDRLRIPAARAKARLAAARDTGPRRTLAGDPLGPVYPRLAAAQAAGEVDADAARLIRRFLDTLPGELALRRGPHAETEMEAVVVDAATRVDTRGLSAVIERLRAYVDPDGAAPREQEIQARRFLDLTTRADGTGRLAGELTREATAALAAVLDPLAAPAPATDGAVDPRTAAQRRHDGLLDACTRLLRADALPDAGGVPTTILLSIDARSLTPARPGSGTDAAASDVAASEGGTAGGSESVAALDGAVRNPANGHSIVAAPRMPGEPRTSRSVGRLGGPGSRSLPPAG